MTRLKGTDGVSLEADKWISVLEEMGHECFYFAGEHDTPVDRSCRVEEAHFMHPEIARLNQSIFYDKKRDAHTSDQVERIKEHLKAEIEKFLDKFGIDVIMTENTCSLPVNLPLGLAVAEIINERAIPSIGHHHDFWWERKRFMGAPADDYLKAAFPPTSPSMHHVVINSVAQRHLAYRCGLSSHLIPNVMDFDTPPPQGHDEISRNLRNDLGIPEGNLLFLQPTRVVPRKRIEKAIEFTRWVDRPATLLITHAAGDEGYDYQDCLRRTADLMGVDAKFISGRFAQHRGEGDDGVIYSLADAYLNADLVTYPSDFEGFGNAFLETIYHKRPIVITAYEIFKLDIEPKGFKTLRMEEFPTADLVTRTHNLLDNPGEFEDWIEGNYELGKAYFNYANLRQTLDQLLNEIRGGILRRRLKKSSFS
jgi:glycosyltransferase involved in cell wall biosynthesis